MYQYMKMLELNKTRPGGGDVNCTGMHDRVHTFPELIIILD